MSTRSRRAAPSHAPAWVRPRHWPALTGVFGMAALVAVVAALGGHSHENSTRPKAIAAVTVQSVAPVNVAAAAPQVGDAVVGVDGSTSAADPIDPLNTVDPVLPGDVSVAGSTSAAPSDRVHNVGAGLQHQPAPADAATISGLTTGGIPVTALDAYRKAATHELTLDPSCHIPWPLLAGIGRVESNHGRYGGAVLLSDGTSTKRILGIPLDGSRSATITDTDHGRLDGDPVYDRALGPMQFIPSTWASYGADGNGDGVKDPFNIFDAAAAAAHYLCVAGGDLSTLTGQTRAVLAYNHSSDYLALVLNLERAYAVGVPGLIVPVLPPQTGHPAAPSSGASTTPVSIAPLPGGHKPPPPVDPGPPLSAPSPPSAPHPPSSSSSSPKPHPTSARPSSSTSTRPTSAPPTSASSSDSSTSSAPPVASPIQSMPPVCGPTDSGSLSESSSGPSAQSAARADRVDTVDATIGESSSASASSSASDSSSASGSPSSDDSSSDSSRSARAGFGCGPSVAPSGDAN